MPERPYQLVPIRRVDVYREVLERVESYIRENNLGPGDRVPSDRDLSHMLRVSRGSVRQAIKTLESIGRVSAQQGSGTYVREPSYRAGIAQLVQGLTFDVPFLRQLVPVRNAIEVAILEAAFQRRTTANLTAVQAALTHREQQLGHDPQPGSLDFSFEAALGAICGNELLRRMQALIHDLWVTAWMAVGEAPGRKQLLHDEHLVVFERFRAGDLAGALREFRKHLDMAPRADGRAARGAARTGRRRTRR